MTTATAQQLIIPERINVGFQKRDDTYTKKLAYVIYYDHKGKLRKEASWNSWRDKSIDPVEFVNEPTDGFVLNKNVGGYKSDWNYRSAHIRVYDPRDFEFEIGLENLLFILRECDCNKGKGLEGRFVYAWDGKELVLLPEGSADYQNSKHYTELQTQTVKVKELILGASYMTKSQQVMTYLGKFPYHKFFDSPYEWRQKKKNPNGKPLTMQVFWDGEHYQCLDSLKTIAKLHSETIDDKYAELVDGYNNNYKHGSPVVDLVVEECEHTYPDRVEWFEEYQKGVFHQFYTYSSHSPYVYRENKYLVADGNVKSESISGNRYVNKENKTIPSSSSALYAILANGLKVKATY